MKRTGKEPGDGEADDSGPRIVQSVELKRDQWGALSKAAQDDGVPLGTWIRMAALQKARKAGFWNPFSRPGPKKVGADPDEEG